MQLLPPQMERMQPSSGPHPGAGVNARRAAASLRGIACVCSGGRRPTASAWYAHPTVRAGATLLSFVVALAHFVMELFVFKTMSIKGAASPMVVAGESEPEMACRGADQWEGSSGRAALEANGGTSKWRPVQHGTGAVWHNMLLAALPLGARPHAPTRRSASPPPTGLSTLWMGAGWNYYTYHVNHGDLAAAQEA